MKIRKGNAQLGHSAGNGQSRPNTSQPAGGAIENDYIKDAIRSKAQEPSQKSHKNGESSEDKILAEANTTPDVIKSNTSTPRRKKDPLANLYSSLSPKYIGFSTPKSSSLSENLTPASGERGCTTRRKKISNNSVNELFISSTDAIGYVRRTNSSNITSSPVSSSDSELAFQRRSFESPIEKLLRKNRTNDSIQTSPSPSCVFEHNFPKAKSKQLERKELMDIKVKVARVESLEMLHKNGINTVHLDQHDKVINIKNILQSEEEPKAKRRDTNDDSEHPTFSSDCFESKEHAPKKTSSTSDDISVEIHSEAKNVVRKKNMNCSNSESRLISSEVDKRVEDINIEICEEESNSKDRVKRKSVETDNLVSLKKNSSMELYATGNTKITSDATSESVEISKEVEDITNKTVNCFNSADHVICSEDDKNVEGINLCEEESNSQDRVKRKSVEIDNFDNLTKDSSIAYNIDEEIVILDTTDESIDNSVVASEDCNQSASEDIECVENVDDTTADCQNIESEPQFNINKVDEENKSCDIPEKSEKNAINIIEVPTINNGETRNNKLEENTLNNIDVECNEACMATKVATQNQDHHMKCAAVEYEQQELETGKILPETNKHKSSQEINAKDVDLEVNMPVNIISINSPSSVSMDSAKGSSVNNDVSWVSFSSGDIFWGQIYSYCYWPCMVCPDPDGKTISTDVGTGRNIVPHVMVHVRFFADNGRRNWVKRDKLFPFTGLENYQQRMLEAEEKYGRKNSIYKAFVVSRGKQRLWNLAIEEANILRTTSPEKRLNKFNEIYENSKLLSKLERKRRQSMYITLGSTSDIGSLYDSSDNLSLKQPSTGSKRERSISPFSPAFSPVGPKTSKRQKLDEEEEPTTSLNSTTNYQTNFPEENTPAMETPLSQSSFMSSSSQQDEEIFNSNEFKIFFKAMREFVMKQNNDEKLERSLVVAVRNIWALKHINNRQMQARAMKTPEENDLGSLVVGGVGTCGSFKRLSNRLRNLSLNRSLSKMNTPQLTIIQPKPAVSLTQDTQNEEKVKKPINRPIEEVIDDIFNLDNKYLFKGLGRDPICKYCLKPGGLLEKCSKNCQSMFHVDCMEKSKVQKKHPRKTKAITTITTLLDESTVDKNFTLHITADDIEQHEVPEDRGNEKTAENLNDTTAPNIALMQAGTSAKSDNAVCLECSADQEPKCLVCNRKDLNQEEIVHCNIPHCLNACHPACCKYWPQAKITKSKNKIETFRCPSHVCHTCVSDDPKGKFQNISSSKLTKCIKCPATFHTDSTCIPAGSQILTAAYVICPRHSISKSDQNVNVNWCFICVKGGQVVCCETCPTAVHASCLNIPINSDEGYICEECETGRMPLYGEMVWAKFNNFRWWPAIILPPTEIPNNIMRMAHGSSDFVVRFFGTHDHGWISRRRVYLYLEGDSTEPPKYRTSLDNNYTRGVEEAKRIWEIIKSKKNVQRLTYESKQKLHPQPYVKIKSNRAVPPLKLHIDMDKVSKCECSKDSEEPCGTESNCLNRVLYHECNPKLCPAGERCQNQMFESRISPKMEVVYMKERGFGLICREPISAGTFVIEYVGEVINDDEFKQRMTQKSIDRDENFYFLSLEKDYIIDAGPKGNLARFMNHSCDPNCETQKWSVNGLNRVGLFAITDIPADTELTFNYHWDELLGSEKKTCYCGAAKCAGQIGEKFKETKVKIDTKAMKSNSKNKGSKGAKAKPLKRLQKNDRTSGNIKSFVQIKPKSILKKGKSIEITLLNNTLGNNNEEPITEG